MVGWTLYICVIYKLQKSFSLSIPSIMAQTGCTLMFVLKHDRIQNCLQPWTSVGTFHLLCSCILLQIFCFNHNNFKVRFHVHVNATFIFCLKHYRMSAYNSRKGYILKHQGDDIGQGTLHKLCATVSTCWDQIIKSFFYSNGYVKNKKQKQMYSSQFSSSRHSQTSSKESNKKVN